MRGEKQERWRERKKDVKKAKEVRKKKERKERIERKSKKESKEHLICNLSTLIFDHSEGGSGDAPYLLRRAAHPTSPPLQGPFTAVWDS